MSLPQELEKERHPELQQFPSLLLIDDDPISREVLLLQLEMHGFPIEVAKDGPTAIARLGNGRSLPQVILMDTQMPGLSGLELIAALRASTPAHVIAISGSEPGEAIRHATDGFLLKPIQPEDLVALLHAANAPGPESEATAHPSESISLVDSLVDPIVLGKLKAMMPASAVREIYAAVAADLKSRLYTLNAAMQADDSLEVARIAHAIKGGCAMVGLTSAKDAAARLEISNLPVTWPAEMSQLRIALAGLEGMLGDEFPL